MKKFIYICFLSIFLFSCSDDDKLPNFAFELTPITEGVFPDSFTYSENNEFTLKYSFPDECRRFSRLYTNTEHDSIITIYLEAYVDKDAECEQEIVNDEETFQITANITKDYVFKLWSGNDDDGNSTFLEYTVPVIDPDDQP